MNQVLKFNLQKMKIDSNSLPVTKEILIEDFRQIGLEEGMTVIVHSSLKSIGWVCGGAETVILALTEVLTENGTLVMPTHTSDNSDPKEWENPPVPESWFQIIRDSMPSFDPKTTPTSMMGKIPETFRNWHNVKRSYHPCDSFAAWGKNANLITENHSLDFAMGEDSPLGKMYKLNSFVLLLGVNYNRNTSFHLAEYRQPKLQIETAYGAILENGKRVWKDYKEIPLDADDFLELGKDFEAETNLVTQKKIGEAKSKFFPQKPAIDFASNWILKNR